MGSLSSYGPRDPLKLPGYYMLGGEHRASVYSGVATPAAPAIGSIGHAGKILKSSRIAPQSGRGGSMGYLSSYGARDPVNR